MSARIRIDHGQDAGKVWRLAGPGSYVIGRDPGISIRVLDMKVSKAHCRVIIQGEGAESQAILEDLKSTHGTQLNGQPVTSLKRLQPGDEIRLGLSILRFLSDGAADAEAVPHEGGVDSDTVTVEEKAAGTAPKRRKTFPPTRWSARTSAATSSARRSVRAAWARSTRPNRSRSTGTWP